MGADPRVAACSSTVHLPDFRCIFDKRHDPHLMDVLKSKWGGGGGERGDAQMGLSLSVPHCDPSDQQSVL